MIHKRVVIPLQAFQANTSADVDKHMIVLYPLLGRLQCLGLVFNLLNYAK